MFPVENTRKYIHGPPVLNTKGDITPPFKRGFYSTNTVGGRYNMTPKLFVAYNPKYFNKQPAAYLFSVKLRALFFRATE